MLPSAYQAALHEVTRRREFNLILDRKFKKLQSFIETEEKTRKKLFEIPYYLY